MDSQAENGKFEGSILTYDSQSNEATCHMISFVIQRSAWQLFAAPLTESELAVLRNVDARLLDSNDLFVVIVAKAQVMLYG